VNAAHEACRQTSVDSHKTGFRILLVLSWLPYYQLKLPLQLFGLLFTHPAGTWCEDPVLFAYLVIVSPYLSLVCCSARGLRESRANANWATETLEWSGMQCDERSLPSLPCCNELVRSLLTPHVYCNVNEEVDGASMANYQPHQGTWETPIGLFAKHC
jgi:hypothetical protein